MAHGWSVRSIGDVDGCVHGSVRLEQGQDRTGTNKGSEAGLDAFKLS